MTDRISVEAVQKGYIIWLSLNDIAGQLIALRGFVLIISVENGTCKKCDCIYAW